MPDVANLQVKVSSKGVKTVTRELDKMKRSAGKTEKATDGLGKSIFKLGRNIAVAATAMAAFNKAISEVRKLQSWNAGLVTATGSIEQANKAFAALEQFGKSTPFSLEQSVSGYTKLTNLGLKPTEAAMVSLGNTAVAKRKDLMQLIEAVADAATFEFERVKEAFDVISRQTADEVAFTFKGVTTTVKKNAKDITAFLISIGETNFAGAMEREMDTLNGQFATLAFNWDKMWRDLGDSVLAEDAANGLKIVNGMFDDLETFSKSGAIQLIANHFNIGFNSIINIIDEANEAFDELSKDMSEDGSAIQNSVNAIVKGIRMLLPTVIFVFRNVANLVVTFGTIWITLANTIVDAFKIAFETVTGIARGFATDVTNLVTSAMHNITNPFNQIPLQFTDLAGEAASKAANDMVALGKKTADAFTGLFSVGTDQIKEDWEELATSMSAIYNGSNVSDLLRDIKEITRNFKPVATPFPNFPKGKGKTGDDKEAEKVTALLQKELDALIENLAKREETLESQSAKELEILQRGLDQRLISEEQFATSSAIIFKTLEEQKAKDHQEALQTTLAVTADGFGAISDLAATFGKKGAKIAKGAAIAEATVNMFASAQAAYKAVVGTPGVGPAIAPLAAAAALVAGAANIASIRSTAAPAFAGGGVVGGSSFTGDNVTARVNSGEMILNRQQQATLFKQSNGAANATGTNRAATVNIINQTSEPVGAEVTQRGDGQLDIIVRRAVDTAKAELTDEVNNGIGTFAPTLERTFALRRGQA